MWTSTSNMGDQKFESLALAVVSTELTVTLELLSQLAIHASGQPSFLVTRKSAILSYVHGCDRRKVEKLENINIFG